MKITTEINFSSPSNDEQTMDRSGCNYACLLCSTLCWGKRGHDEDSEETRKHHTCHHLKAYLE